MLRGRRPKWRPLIDLVGDDLADWFMWMYEAELEAVGATVHAYKHRHTRSYLFLTRTGDAYAYTSRGCYVASTPAAELESLSRDWETLQSPADARTQLAAAISRARDRERSVSAGPDGPVTGG